MWRDRWVVLFLSKMVVGDGKEAWQILLTTAPRPRPSRLGQYWQKTLSRCLQHKLQHLPITMPFLTTSTLTLSCLLSAAPQADSRWHGHVEPDDVVIADIGDHALDIVLHGPESAHKNGIVKTNLHSHIHSHTPMHTPKRNKQTNSKTLNSPNMTPSFSCPLPVQKVVVGDGQEAWQMLLTTAPRPRPSRLGHYWQNTFVDVLNTNSSISRQQCPF